MEPSQVTPTFRGELYFLIAKFLEDGPCREAAQKLRQEITANALVPARYDWTGASHPKTFRDMEEEFGTIAPEFLVQRCFELCTATADPTAPPVRSLFSRAASSSSNAAGNKPLLTRPAKVGNYLQNIQKLSLGFSTPGRVWHEKYLSRQFKYLRRTLGHLSAVYCLTFDRTGQVVITGADDLLVKCWSLIDGRLIHTFRGASSEISDLAVSHDNRLMAAGSCDKIIRVWNLHTAAPVAVLSRHAGMITAVNFCPTFLDNNTFFLASTSGDGSVSFWKYRYNEYNVAEFEETPTRYHEKIRPGQAQMICASFSPGGIFFCVGSADHNVRVYKMDCTDGPQRILEDDSHSDRVDSIQWCNQPALRFLSGSKDGTARIWSFVNHKWTSIVLNMSTGDNREKKPQSTSAPTPSIAPSSSLAAQPGPSSGDRSSLRRQPSASNAGNVRPVRAAAAAAASTFATAAAAASHHDENGEETAQSAAAAAAAAKLEKRVTMVAWSLDDRKVITAVSDLTLKIWDSSTGHLISTLHGHEDEILVLEPHPISVNILLTAAHDGQICVWDISTLSCLYKYRNFIETQGHAAVFDAKWSPDGTMICASDSHGQLHFIGHGSSERFEVLPAELFFHTDYRPVVQDLQHYVVDEQTQLPPHLMPPPFLVDSDGAPYPAYIQKFAPGRAGLTDQQALLPFGPDVGPPLLAMIQQQQQQQQLENAPLQQPQASNSSRPPSLDNLMSNDSNSSSVPESRSDTDNNSGPDRRLDIGGDDQQPGPSRRNVEPEATLKLVVLASKLKKKEIDENLERIRDISSLESSIFLSESQRDSFDHDYAARSSMSRHRLKKTKARGAPRRVRPPGAAASSVRSTSRAEAAGDDDDDEDDEEGNQEEQRNGRDEDDTSDMSLDESDFSEESTTEVSSEHSDWGSDNQDRKTPTSGAGITPTTSGRRRSPKDKKKRRAAQKCRERMLMPENSEALAPSTWLAETLPKKSPYFPQIGDVLMYFKQGHEKYLELVKTRETYKINMHELQWMKKKTVPDSCMVKIIKLGYEIKPPRLVNLKLAIVDQSTGNLVGESFNLRYHDMNDVVDFLVLYQAYNSYRGKHWKKGDRIRCQIDDCWWKGTVNKVDNYEGSKRSPFLSIHVHWDNSEKEDLSPWDLEALDHDTAEIEDGTPVTLEQIRSSLYVPTSEEWNAIGRDSECTRIAEALESIMSLAIAEPFNYPVDTTAYPEYLADVACPVDLTMIKSRVENHFYRRIDAIKFDLELLYKNAASFNRPQSDIVRNAKIIWETGVEIVSNPNKTKDDVSAIYHRLVESFEWSKSESDDDDDGSENMGRGKRLSRSAKGKTGSPDDHKTNPKQWKRDCNELLDEMFANPLSEPFREPVSEIEYPDYHRFIATPMDLSTVRESLLIGEYQTPVDLQKDVALMFRNSKQYNTDSKSKILTITAKLEAWFDKRMSRLLHDWRRTKRRLSGGRSSRSKSETRKGYKGKGKGTGKGQSNRIKRKKQRSDDDDDESESEESEEESEFSEMEDKKPIRSHSRLPSPSATRPNNRTGVVKEEIVDPNNPQPCSSRTALRSAKATTASTSSGDIKNETEHLPDQDSVSSPDFGQRRTSNRQHKTPARFLDESLSPAPHSSTSAHPHPSSALKDPLAFDDTDQSDDDEPLSSRRVTNKASSTLKKTTSNEESSVRPLRTRQPKKTDKDFKYLNDDDGSLEDEEDEENSSEASDSEEEKPLVQRKIQKRKNVDASHEHQPTPKKSRRALTSDDEEDLPLAVTKKSSNTESHRPVRAARTVKSLEEPASDDEAPLTTLRRQTTTAPVTRRGRSPQLDHDSSEDDSSTDRRKKKRNKNVLPPARTKRKKQSEESESEFSDEEEEDDDEEDLTEDDDFDDNDVDFIDDDDGYGRAARGKGRGKRKASKARTNVRPRATAVASRRARTAVDSESEGFTSPERGFSSKGSRSRRGAVSTNKLTNRNSGAGSRDTSGDIRSGRSAKQKKPNYNDSDHNSSSERENRRPMRAAAKKNKFVNRNRSEEDDSSDFDDDEESSVALKTTVTSRGRVCKPNRRTID